MFCYTLLYVHSSFAIILMGKRELVALLSMSSWCLMMVVWLFLAVPWVCLRFVIVLFSDHTHLPLLYLMIVHKLSYILCTFDNFSGSVELRHYNVYTTVGVLTICNFV